MSGRIKVMTMVDGIGTYGGGESLARQVAQRLDPERFESVFCVTRWEHLPEYEPALDELRAAGVEFIGIERSSRFDLRAWNRLRERIRSERIDVLHTHKFGSNYSGALLARRAGVPVFIAHEHGWEFADSRWRRLLDRRLVAARADAFVVVSESDRRRTIERVGVPTDKVRMIGNGIPPLRRTPGPEAILAEGDGPVVGTVATLRPVKNLGLLIGAAARLREEFPGLRVLIAGGPGPIADTDRDRLEALVAELGLGESVRFLGQRADVDRVLEALDVAVLTSKREGSPLSVMEYMAAGLPVVATRVGGVPDIVEDGITGTLVAPGDVAGLSTAIAELLHDPERARRLGEAGRERQAAEFTIEATTRRVEALYEDLLAVESRR